jgi:hexokinase
MRASLRTLVGPEVESRVDIGMAKDGSGVGGESNKITPLSYLHSECLAAALCALVAQRQSLATRTNGAYAYDHEDITIPVRTEAAYVSSLSQ